MKLLTILIFIILQNEYSNASEDCEAKTLKIDSLNISTGLFKVDALTFGVINQKPLRTISFYRINSFQAQFTLIHRARLQDYEVPVDACSDGSGKIFVLTTDTIVSHLISFEYGPLDRHLDKSIQFEFKKIKSEMLYFRPTGISCHNNLIYVVGNNNARIFVHSPKTLSVKLLMSSNRTMDSIINFRKIPRFNYYAFGLAIDQNIGIFGVFKLFEKVVLFNDNFTVHSLPRIENIPLEYLEKKANCVEDIEILTRNKTSSDIFILDSCERVVKHFVYTRVNASYERLVLEQVLYVHAEPISIIAHPAGYLIVLVCEDANYLTSTYLKIFDLKKCDLFEHLIKKDNYLTKYSQIEMIINELKNTTDIQI